MKAGKVIWVVALPCLSETSDAQEVYLQGGTLGIGVGAAWSVTSWFGVRADFNAINLSHNFEVGGNRYEDDIRLRQGGLYGDFFPWAGTGFRVTAGLRLTDNEVSGNSVPTNGMYVFEGKASPAFPGEYATATARYPTTMPYLGIGYGLHPRKRLGARGRSRCRLWHSEDLVHAVAGTIAGGRTGDESADHQYWIAATTR
ncbi:conserved hypothetical protein [Paraburkholderia atlantica]|uniref:Uncharacterized protein n=1 Tax=Paraburkholderia atlantica TaxID=2654982 RepID=D5WC66_PARAM|nr:conserved hypothetical protein [Paraburkholderia atlantica]